MTSSKAKKAKSASKRGDTKLRYLLDVTPGYGRVRCGRGYYYTDLRGKRITDLQKLKRLRALVIPPAWKEVWISPSKQGHLQATGIDEQGRKQYLYHPKWTEERQRKKLMRMVAFGQVLPQIRRQVATDLRVGRLVKKRVVATALKVIEETLMRVGNEHYFRKYGSHGLTTLKKKHVGISTGGVVFRFRGKKGVRQEISVRNVRLASRLSEFVQLRGPYLFQYKEGAKLRRLRAADINAYIQLCTDRKFSTKDYRTWYAGVWAFHLFARCGEYASEQECQANIVCVLDEVSRRLGNTRAVCKQYYVPDSIIRGYKEGTLLPYLNKIVGNGRQFRKKETENMLLSFLGYATATTS